MSARPDALTSFDFASPPADPVSVIREWFDIAILAGVREPGACALATAGKDGRASTRIVQILEITDQGLIFATHAYSPKGRQIAESGWSSGVFYWRELGRQLIVAGPTSDVDDQASDMLWAARPASTHPMSVVSVQSDPLGDEKALRLRAAELRESGRRLARPKEWRGYCLAPVTVEFWTSDQDRLHQRLHYRMIGQNWVSTRLQP